jgi:hypothetical protein
MENNENKEVVDAVSKAERRLSKTCEDSSVGEYCRSACLIGGMEVISAILEAYEIIPPKKEKAQPKELGIIVSPFEDCPSGFEEIIVKTPRNPKVKLCRLDAEHRRKWAPKGRPATPGATKGALRRKRGFPRGVTIRPISRGGE